MYLLDQARNTALGDGHRQFAGLCLLDFISGLMMESPKESFTPAEIVDWIGCLKSSPDLFSEPVRLHYEAIDVMLASGIQETI